jgi:hypothetical protein
MAVDQKKNARPTACACDFFLFQYNTANGPVHTTSFRQHSLPRATCGIITPLLSFIMGAPALAPKTAAEATAAIENIVLLAGVMEDVVNNGNSGSPKEIASLSEAVAG